jgi:hypothetical protein
VEDQLSLGAAPAALATAKHTVEGKRAAESSPEIKPWELAAPVERLSVRTAGFLTEEGESSV